jgi:hypothetical protein
VALTVEEHRGSAPDFLVPQPFVNRGASLGDDTAVRARTAAAVERTERASAGLLESRGRRALPVVLPWERDPMCRRTCAQAAPETSDGQLVYHLGSPRRYSRYLHRIALGPRQ